MTKADRFPALLSQEEIDRRPGARLLDRLARLARLATLAPKEDR